MREVVPAAETTTTFTDYADLLEQGYGAELWREPRDLERTVAAVWEVSFSKVEVDSPASAALLTLCAFLAPDNIPLDAIRASAAALPELLRGVAARPVAFNAAVGALFRYSLACRNGEALSIQAFERALAIDEEAFGPDHPNVARDINNLGGVYLNNRIEADHGALKRLIRPTRGFQSMKTAYATIKGFEIMRMIRRRHCMLIEP